MIRVRISSPRPGHYRLYVRAIDAAGNAARHPAALSFTVGRDR